VTNEVAGELGDDFDFYSTFGWHPLAVEAAIATQEFWRQHRSEVLENVSERTDELRHRLSIMDFEGEPPEIRIQGLAVGIGLGDAAYVSHIEKQCRAAGLLVFAEDDSLVMFPPLTLDHETLDEALGILAQAARR
jgi:putrescine aminotransferase